MSNIDKPITTRKGEELHEKTLLNFLRENLTGNWDSINIKQFPGGFSNLTYLISTAEKEFVLRKPPIGAAIKSAHDMSREFNVLSLLNPIYTKIPKPILFCNNQEIIGSPFYLMERVKGIILRTKIPKGIDITSNHLKKLSLQSIENLVELHNLELDKSNLISLGKPKGYVKRQVVGWTKRYFKAEIDPIKSMNFVAEWMESNQKESEAISFIHNDYKYDNLVLDPNSLEIKAVLDWEMSTVGDPLMDLGSMLSYWVEKNEHPALLQFNLTWLDGNLTRQEVIENYATLRNVKVEDILFYYVFGCFKLAVIAQQIYARYKKGLTNDKRFAGLIHVVNACSKNAENAIKYNRINNFY